jgi:hypothetical protein
VNDLAVFFLKNWYSGPFTKMTKNRKTLLSRLNGAWCSTCLVFAYMSSSLQTSGPPIAGHYATILTFKVNSVSKS